MANISRREETTPAVRSAREWDPFQTMRELMRWNPFQETAPRLWRGADERFAIAPAFDVRETKDAYIFKADLPGFREEDIDVHVAGNRLTVSGKRESEQVDDADTYYCCERSSGSFTRSFTLPDGVNPDQVQADLKEGVLSLLIPKTAEAQPKRIQLRSGPNGNEKKAKA
jgi:HSP20 family protein